MAERKLSRQELNRRRRRSGFIGRRGELSAFRENLSRDPADEAFQYLFHVHGQAGVGKTSLVRQWETVAREHQAVTAYLDDDVRSVIEAMETISSQLGRQQVVLKRFEKLLANYRRQRHQAEAVEASAAARGAVDSAAESGQLTAASASSTVIAQAGLAGLGMVPGMGAVAGAMDPQQLAHSTDRLRAALSARLGNQDDVQLVLSPVRVLTPVFLQDLAEAAEQHDWVVLFFDVFEQTGPVLNTWLRDVLTGEEYGELPPNLLAVLSGQGRLDTRCWGDDLELVFEVPLEVFTEDEARRLLATRGITDADVIEVILHLTGRLPVLVDLLAQTRPHDVSEIGDPSDTAVERFLKWETHPHRRAAALVCALPLQLDEDLFRIVAPEAAADEYAWLRSLPFVTGQAGRCRYHDVVRTPMVRLQRTQSPAFWQQQHILLANAYQQRRRILEDGLPADQRWNDATWREHRFNELYHRLCADPHQALPDALQQAVHACDLGVAVLRRWSQILAQSGNDSSADVLTSWAQRLMPSSAESAEADVATVLVTALTQLTSVPNLPGADQALVHCLLGREHRQAKRYQQALSAYATALTLDPRHDRAHYGRGITHLFLGRYDDALTDLSRAVELNPDDDKYIADRGFTHRAMEHYDDALSDLNRAIELNPDAWVLAQRGETHRLMEDHDEALSDFNRAIELDHDYAWAIASRGQTHRAMEHYDDALSDFNRAIELDHDYAWAIASRGQTHRAMEHYDDALSDLNRAIELNPDLTWVLAQRGETHRAMEHYDDALSDLNRAIELNPDLTWVLAQRGETHRLMEHYDDALSDLNRAIELDHDYAWAIASRGQTHRAMEHYDDALSDLNRAIELDHDYAWAIASRGQTHRAMEHYDDALSDLNRAIELNPDYAWAIAQRGETHRLMEHYDDALSDFNRAIELDHDYAWAIASRGQTHHAMEHYDDALSDLNRAIELNNTYAWAIAQRGVTHRTMEHYDDALTDLTRAIELDPNEAWFHFESAVALRLLGRSQEHEHWHRAVEMLTSDASTEGPAATDAMGNLVVVYCALPEWDKAVETLERFLARAPAASRIREALEDLAELQKTLPTDPDLRQLLRQRLESAAAGEPM
ncbi:tetratricopeptide repeat protein [Streptomyces spinosirectus]